MTRAVALGVLLAAATASPCTRIPFKPYTQQGETKRGLSLAVTESTAELTENGKPVWSQPLGSHWALFAKDDSWVAFSSDTHQVTIVSTKPGAKPFTVDIVAQLTKAERAAVPDTSCGLRWFAGWDDWPPGLRVKVAVGGIAFLVTPDGAVRRL